MKRVAIACLLAGLWTALCIGAYSISQTAMGIETLGVMAIAFLYAMAVAIICGIPVALTMRRIGALNIVTCALVGAVLGSGVLIAQVVFQRGADKSVTMLGCVLAVAGAISGVTFARLLKA